MKAHNEDATMNLFQSSLLIGTSNSSLVILWTEMNENKSKWMEINGNEWKWMNMNKNNWKLTK